MSRYSDKSHVIYDIKFLNTMYCYSNENHVLNCLGDMCFDVIHSPHRNRARNNCYLFKKWFNDTSN